MQNFHPGESKQISLHVMTKPKQTWWLDKNTNISELNERICQVLSAIVLHLFIALFTPDVAWDS